MTCYELSRWHKIHSFPLCIIWYYFLLFLLPRPPESKVPPQYYYHNLLCQKSIYKAKHMHDCSVLFPCKYGKYLKDFSYQLIFLLWNCIPILSALYSETRKKADVLFAQIVYIFWCLLCQKCS